MTYKSALAAIDPQPCRRGGHSCCWRWRSLRYHEYTHSSPIERCHLATSIRLSAETEERLRFLATQTGRSKAFYLRELIENGIDDLEDYYLASDVLERVRKGQERLHSAADVKAELALEG